MLRTRPVILGATAAISGVMASGVLMPGAAAGSPAHARPGSVTWTKRRGPVPGVAANGAPALTEVMFPGKTTRTVLLWTGPAAGSGDRISYKSARSLRRDSWSASGLVDDGKAVTDRRASAARYGGTSASQVIVAWKTPGSAGRILYSVGSATKADTLSWGPGLVIPGAVSSAGPSVYGLRHSAQIFVTWKAATGHAIDYVLGAASAKAGVVTWGKIGVIPGAATIGTPAVAEASTAEASTAKASTAKASTGKGGRLYVLWQGLGRRGPLDVAWTADPVAARPVWTSPVAFPSAVMTSNVPAGQATGTGGSYPLLVVYRAWRGSGLLQVTLAASGKVTRPQKVPALRSRYGPALFAGTLAATAPDPGEVFYERQVHPCAGC
jgi:hypothetical protein